MASMNFLYRENLKLKLSVFKAKRDFMAQRDRHSQRQRDRERERDKKKGQVRFMCVVKNGISHPAKSPAQNVAAALAGAQGQSLPESKKHHKR